MGHRALVAEVPFEILFVFELLNYLFFEFKIALIKIRNIPSSSLFSSILTTTECTDKKKQTLAIQNGEATDITTMDSPT